jgi:dephospho-CoA kinase
MLPLQFNDGREVAAEARAEAVLEILAGFGGASYEAQPIEGHWVHEGVHYRDNHAKLVADVRDLVKNRCWMKQFKQRWKNRLDRDLDGQLSRRGRVNTKPVVGLIGGIGSGKSLVAAELAKHGGRIVSGDKAGHEALMQPEIREQIVRRFGADMLDAGGAVDRKKMGARVFADPAERQALERIVFPYIKDRLRAEIAAAQQDPQVGFVVLDAAIMLEAGWNNACEVLVYIHAPRAARLDRLARHRGWSAKEVAARERAQITLTDKVSCADWAIDNSGTPEETARQVADLADRLGNPHRQFSAEFR